MARSVSSAVKPTVFKARTGMTMLFSRIHVDDVVGDTAQAVWGKDRPVAVARLATPKAPCQRADHIIIRSPLVDVNLCGCGEVPPILSPAGSECKGCHHYILCTHPTTKQQQQDAVENL
eukprot:scaffold1225_cov164-Amphora_coffeaeformis.AAC.24